MNIKEAIIDIRENIKPSVGGKSLDMAVNALQQQLSHELTYVTKKGTIVDYGRIPNVLVSDMNGIIYYISTSTDKDHADGVREVVNMLQSDSYDHGSEWRKTEHRIIEATEYNTCSLISFRVKDSF